MDDRKERKPEGPEKKSVSERKRTANRMNAQQSTGPKTRPGKENSKMNAVKHGIMCDQLIIRNGEGKEDLAAFERLLAGLHEHYRPVGALENLLVQSIVGCFWKKRRAQRYEGGAIQRRISEQRDAETAWGEGRFQEALAAGASLEQSARGIEYLLDGLATAIEQVQQGGWSVDSGKLLTDHFLDRIRVPSTPAKAMDRLPEDVDPKQLIKELKAQRDRLRARLPEVEATEAHEREAWVQHYTLPEGHELDLVLRYEAALDRKLHKAMDRLDRVQAARSAAESAAGDKGAGPPTPQR